MGDFDQPVLGASWRPVPLFEILEGLIDGTLEMPKPTVGQIDDGLALFYVGAVNGLAGESGSGKTWTALAVAAQVLTDENMVLYIDYEDHAANIVGRLLALGVDDALVGRFFKYVAPISPFDHIAMSILREEVLDYAPMLVVIDSAGESLAMDGANPNADEDVSAWFGKIKAIGRAIAETSDGAAVVVLDHTPKVGGDEGLWPIGSQRKRAAITGVQYMQRRGKPFSRDREGNARLICAKDRHGHYRLGQHVADLHVTPDGDRVTVRLSAPNQVTDVSGRFRPTGYMERVSLALEVVSEPLTGNGVVERVGGKKSYVLDALAALVAEGYVATAPGQRNATLHTSIKAYREADDNAGEPVTAESGSMTGSTGSGSLGGEPGNQWFGSSREPVGTSGEPVESELVPQCVVCGSPLMLVAVGRDTCERCRRAMGATA